MSVIASQPSSLSDRDQPRGPVAALALKEIRQLLPLALALGAASAAISVIGTLTADSRWLNSLDLTAWPILPVLFAAGAGAMSVSQEKELRTMSWLGSLPIAANRLVAIKLGVAGLWLLFLWAVWWLFSSADSQVDVGRMWVNSGWLLIAGFAVAWLLDGAMSSLLTLAAVATIPSILAWSAVQGERIFGSGYEVYARAGEIQIAITLVFAVVAIGVTFWTGRRYLAPRSAPAQRLVTDKTYTDADARPPRIAGPLAGPSTAVLWQRVHEHPAMNAVLAIVVTSGLAAMLTIEVIDADAWVQVLAFAIAGVPLAVCVWGVSAFTAGGSTSGSRFLADRGVRPWTIWAARHVLPAAIVSAAILIFTIVTAIQIETAPLNTFLYPSMLMMVWAAVAIYGVSQWVSQMITLLPASALAAPLMSVTVLGYLGFAWTDLSTPTWLVGGLTLLPLVATALAMGEHVDGRRAVKFWAIHGGALALIVLVPLTIGYLKFTQTPAIPTAQRDEMISLSKLVPSRQTGEIRWLSRGGDVPRAVYDLSIDGLSDFDNQTAADLVAVVDQAGYGPAMFDPYFLDETKTLGDYRANRLALNVGIELIPTMILAAKANVVYADGEAASAAAWAEFQRVLRGSTAIAAGLRASYSLDEQTAADAIEMTMVATMDDPETRAKIQDGFAAMAVELVTDSAARQRDRRASVLAVHRASRNQSMNPDLPIDSFILGMFETARRERLTEVYLHTLFEMTRAIEAGRPLAPLRQRLHKVSHWSSMPLDISPLGERWRTESGNGIAAVTMTNIFPGSVWGDEWERVNFRGAL